MNLCLTLLKVVLALVFIEAVLGDLEGGDLGSNTIEGGGSSGTVEQGCPPELVNRVNSSVPLENFPFIIYGCYEKLMQNTTIGKRPNSTEPESETIVHVYCEETSTPLLGCLAEIATQVKGCPDQIFFKVVSIFHEYVRELTESGCAQNGQRFITLFKEVSTIKKTSPAFSRDENDKFRFRTIISELDESTVDMPSKLFILHREIKSLVEHINTIPMGQSFKEIMNYFADHLISKVKCIHPKDDTLVTCASIDAASVSSTSICDAKTHGKVYPLYDLLEHDAGKLFESIVTYTTLVDLDIPDKEYIRSNFKHYCATNMEINTRIRPVMIISDMCLNREDKNQFQLLKDSILSALEVVCAGEGIRIADLIFEVYRLKKTTPDHRFAVWDCIDVARATRKHHDDHVSSSKNMRFYHEMETFKGCFVKKIHGDQTNVDAATSLIDEMLRAIKCRNRWTGNACRVLRISHAFPIARGH